MIKPGSTLGIIGGGQLGRMTAHAATALGYKVHIFTDQENSPASQVTDLVTVAEYTDLKALHSFAESVDVVTFEFENIPHKSVKELEKVKATRPSWEVLHTCQNRIREKTFLNDLDIGTTRFFEIKSAKDLKEAFSNINSKCVLKTNELGYDGKGQIIIDKNSDLNKSWKELGTKEAILEEFIAYEKEISVIVARGTDKGSLSFMPTENIHNNGILDTSLAPANISDELMSQAWDITHDIADALDLEGMLAVEFFVTTDKKLLVNEMAPRPHNSGHWTMDACFTSQFEQFVRAVCGIPLGSSDYHSNAVMKNLIGDDVHKWKDFVSDPTTKVHIYGKDDVKEGRKMGHVTTLVFPQDELVNF